MALGTPPPARDGQPARGQVRRIRMSTLLFHLERPLGTAQWPAGHASPSLPHFNGGYACHNTQSLPLPVQQKAPVPLIYKGTGAFLRGGDGGI